MKIDKKFIEINISDEKLFTDVSLIVDSDEFLEEITKIREILKKKFKIMGLLTLEEYDVLYGNIRNTKKEQEFDKIFERSRKKLYLPITFTSVVASAALFGKIDDKTYKPAYLVSKLDCFDDHGQTPDETYSIVISPCARDKDVLKALQEYRDQLGNIEGVSQYKYIHLVWRPEKSKPAVKRHRKWYVAYNEGKPIKEIEVEMYGKCRAKRPHTTKPRLKGCTCFDESTIMKGIRSYQNLIFSVWKGRTF